MKGLTRRKLIIGGGLALTTAAAATAWPLMPPKHRLRKKILFSGEWASKTIRDHVGRTALAREFGPEHISERFPENGSRRPNSVVWQLHELDGFSQWKLGVHGLVQKPLLLSLDDLRSLPSRTQITRHDCVEGWSAIAEWTGTRLSAVLEAAQLKDDAQFVVFHCSDAPGGLPYYESVDLIDAFHPQTILAYDMNGQPLPTGHGAPIRARIERQLGYKSAKFIERIEVVSDLRKVGFGKGGFWQDLADYEWYAGI
ncbi:MAG: molybdopterin-dependent oxidoreductase [Pseudomonadota bacterium]